MAEKLKVQLEDENGNIYYLHTDASVVFCENGESVQKKLNDKIEKSSIVQNATTTATDKVISAAVAKNLQDQITAQNTKMSIGVVQTLETGTTTSGSIKYCKKSGMVTFAVNATFGLHMSAWEQAPIGSALPSGYRPPFEITFPIDTENGITIKGIIDTNGQFKVYNNRAAGISAAWVAAACITYSAASV